MSLLATVEGGRQNQSDRPRIREDKRIIGDGRGVRSEMPSKSQRVV
jgi:electron transfer flavoprotein alpha subunit